MTLYIFQDLQYHRLSWLLDWMHYINLLAKAGKGKCYSVNCLRICVIGQPLALWGLLVISWASHLQQLETVVICLTWLMFLVLTISKTPNNQSVVGITLLLWVGRIRNMSWLKIHSSGCHGTNKWAIDQWEYWKNLERSHGGGIVRIKIPSSQLNPN